MSATPLKIPLLRGRAMEVIGPVSDNFPARDWEVELKWLRVELMA
jgi:hypothetical protein